MSKKSLLIGALALVGLMACQREEVNPNYDPETKEVVTKFVFNVAKEARTKQNAASAQVGSTPFRGLDDAYLFTYAIPSADYKGILPADATADKVYELSLLISQSGLERGDGETTVDESRRVLELSLPLQTNVLLFYGRAPLGDAYDGYANKYDCYGHMDQYEITSASGSTNFYAGARLSNDVVAPATLSDYQKFVIIEKLFAGIQTTLLNHSIAAGTTIAAADAPDGVSNKYAFNATIPTGGIKWKYYAREDGKSPYNPTVDRYPLENKLYNLYKQLTTIHTAQGELRAGSGEATLKVATDLLTVLNEVRCASPLGPEEAVAKKFADEVYNRTLKYYTANTNNEGAPITEVKFRNGETIGTAYLSDAEKAFRPTVNDGAELWPSAEDVSAIAAYKADEFPFNFNLPRGATHISFKPSDETANPQVLADYFYYPQTFNVSGMGVPGAGDTYNALSYFYPAELLYFGNSPIRTTTAEKKVSDYPQGSGSGTGEWMNAASWTGWDDNKVTAATRSVAMQYNINYGVALLETKVQFDPDNETGKLKDNNRAVQIENRGATAAADEKDNELDITAGMFKVTGIIVGGQSKRIGWDHLPQDIGGNFKYGFIYDKAVPASAQSIPASGTSGANYTLVFDNYHANSTQDNVNVAIEFRNDSGKDFYGNHNLIRAGGYFYLIGMLKLPASPSITWPTDHKVPPYNADGSSAEVARVFIQDFMTTATFTLGENSLKSAYLTVPDLRAASMSMGLSVDLKWETGLDFSNVVLGGGSN